MNAAQQRYKRTIKGKAVEKRYRDGHKLERLAYNKMWKRQNRKTIKGYLRNLFYGIKHRCDNSNSCLYKYYGGRGIKCLFQSADKFINYVINNLGYNAYEKIKGLQIDRINNNGHYEKGNIRFATHQENCNNRRKRQCKN